MENNDNITMSRIAFERMQAKDERNDKWIHSERDRRILKRRLIDGICYEPLAAEFDISVRQMKNIIYQAEAKLFKHL